MSYNIRLHEALRPIADGCIASSLKAYELCQNGKYNTDAALVLDFAAETLKKINGILGLPKVEE